MNLKRVISSANMQGSGETIRAARELNPKVRIFARATYLKEHEELRHFGADVVISGEGEIALSMTEFLPRQLGATDERIDRERDRVCSEFFGQLPEDDGLLPRDRPFPAPRGSRDDRAPSV